MSGTTENFYEHNSESQDAWAEWFRETGAERTSKLVTATGRLVQREREASALSSRDAEVREVLEGLATYIGPQGRCWCRTRRGGDLGHRDYCERTRDLFVKLQAPELQKENEPH